MKYCGFVSYFVLLFSGDCVDGVLRFLRAAKIVETGLLTLGVAAGLLTRCCCWATNFKFRLRFTLLVGLVSVNRQTKIS